MTKHKQRFHHQTFARSKLMRSFLMPRPSRTTMKCNHVCEGQKSGLFHHCCSFDVLLPKSKVICQPHQNSDWSFYVLDYILPTNSNASRIPKSTDKRHTAIEFFQNLSYLKGWLSLYFYRYLVSLFTIYVIIIQLTYLSAPNHSF